MFTRLSLFIQCVAGTPILNICVAGENSIQEKVNAIFKGKNKSGKSIDKGAAFPVCVSVNEFVCHYTPFASEDRVSDKQLCEQIFVVLFVLCVNALLISLWS